jgi:hypothetical protein
MPSLSSSLYIGVLAGAAVLFMIYRQFASRRVDESRRSLLIAGALVAWGVVGVSHTPMPGFIGDALLGIGVSAGLVLGVLRGSAVRTWQADDGVWWQRGTRILAALWAISIAARAGLGVAAAHAGISQAASLAELPLFVGVTLAAQSAFVLTRR